MTTQATNPAPASPAAHEAVAKAEARNTADAAVATDPHATHGVVYGVKSPKVWASAATGALAGAAVAGPPGAAVGGLIGFAVQRHAILGGPVGRAMDWVKGKLAKKA